MKWLRENRTRVAEGAFTSKESSIDSSLLRDRRRFCEGAIGADHGCPDVLKERPLGGDNDSFQFDTPLVAGELTTISDFATGADGIALARAVFTQAGALGPLAADAFFIGAAAHDASDRVIYNAGSGALLHDPDGTGAQAVTQFASVSPALALTAGDFTILQRAGRTPWPVRRGSASRWPRR